MQQVNNYLEEISRFLPREARQDILDELRTSIEEQVADHAAQAGREPGSEDEIAVLTRFGHPLKVAAGYQPTRHLIGPALYPVFVQALMTILGLVLSIQVVIILIAGATRGFTISPWGLTYGLLDTAFLVSAIVVAVFALLEYSGERLDLYGRWNPRLPGTGNVHVIKRSDVANNLISEGVFLMWWNDVLLFGNWLSVFEESVSLSLSNVWQGLYWPLNAVMGAFFVLHAYVLMRGLWRRETLVAELVLSLATIAMAVMLLGGGDLIVATGPMETYFLDNVQRGVKMALLVVTGFVLWDAWLALRRLSGRT